MSVTIVQQISDTQTICRFIEEDYANTAQKYLVEGLDLKGLGKEFSVLSIVFERSVFTYQPDGGREQTIPKFTKVDFEDLVSRLQEH